MTSDALFGPDGTQLPDPMPVLPDPLVGPGTAAPAGQGQPVVPTTPAVPIPPGVDTSAMREAIRAALGDEPVVRRPVEEEPAPPPEEPLESLRTPPSGIPVQRPPQAPPQPPSAAQGGGQPQPGGPGPPAAQRPRPPALEQARSDHLTHRHRGSSGGGWIGCIVVLIFVAVVAYNLISALVDAFTGG